MFNIRTSACCRCRCVDDISDIPRYVNRSCLPSKTNCVLFSISQETRNFIMQNNKKKQHHNANSSITPLFIPLLTCLEWFHIVSPSRDSRWNNINTKADICIPGVKD